MTLPDDTVAALRATDHDLGRAIVALVDSQMTDERSRARSRHLIDVARTGRREGIIVVDPTMLPALPRSSFMLIGPSRAFIALESEAGLAELELSIIDRSTDADVSREQRRALRLLRTTLKRWRQDPSVKISRRSILLLEGLLD